MNTLTKSELDEIFGGVPVAEGHKAASPRDLAMIRDMLGPDGQELSCPDSEAPSAGGEHVGDEALVQVEDGEAAGDDQDVAADDTGTSQRGDELTLDGIFDDELPTVPQLFPDWRTLFERRPYIRLTRDPRDGTALLLLGYGYQQEPDGTQKLDNCTVGTTMFRNLISECAPFKRCNDEDTKGIAIAVVPAMPGTKVRLWCGLKSLGGSWRDLVTFRFEVTETGLRLVK